MFVVGGPIVAFNACALIVGISPKCAGGPQARAGRGCPAHVGAQGAGEGGAGAHQQGAAQRAGGAVRCAAGVRRRRKRCRRDKLRSGKGCVIVEYRSNCGVPMYATCVHDAFAAASTRPRHACFGPALCMRRCSWWTSQRTSRPPPRPCPRPRRHTCATARPRTARRWQGGSRPPLPPRRRVLVLRRRPAVTAKAQGRRAAARKSQLRIRLGSCGGYQVGRTAHAAPLSASLTAACVRSSLCLLHKCQVSTTPRLNGVFLLAGTSPRVSSRKFRSSHRSGRARLAALPTRRRQNRTRVPATRKRMTRLGSRCGLARSPNVGSTVVVCYLSCWYGQQETQCARDRWMACTDMHGLLPADMERPWNLVLNNHCRRRACWRCWRRSTRFSREMTTRAAAGTPLLGPPARRQRTRMRAARGDPAAPRRRQPTRLRRVVRCRRGAVLWGEHQARFGLIRNMPYAVGHV